MLDWRRQIVECQTYRRFDRNTFKEFVEVFRSRFWLNFNLDDSFTVLSVVGSLDTSSEIVCGFLNTLTPSASVILGRRGKINELTWRP